MVKKKKIVNNTQGFSGVSGGFIMACFDGSCRSDHVIPQRCWEVNLKRQDVTDIQRCSNVTI